MVRRIKLKAMTNDDFDTFSGAEDFPNGSNSLIDWDVPATRGTMICIADGTGIHFYKYSEKRGTDQMYVKNKKFKNPTEARRYVAHVISVPINRMQLKELGFRKL